MLVRPVLVVTWQNTGTAPDGKEYFGQVDTYYRTEKRDDLIPQEVYALRYTNQIRIDLGVDFLRKHYEANLRVQEDDTYERVNARIENNPPRDLIFE